MGPKFRSRLVGAASILMLLSVGAGCEDIKARKLAGYNAIMLGRTLHNIRTDLAAELGADVGLFDHHHG